MNDIVSIHVRSKMMSGIRNGDTLPEIQVRSFLHARGFRFRLHKASLPGKPDVVLRKWNAVVFVHGCFWHGHADCRYFHLPATHSPFWGKKIGENIKRDRRAIDRLIAMDWRVAIIWECALRDEQNKALARLVKFLAGRRHRVEIRSHVSFH